MKLIDVLMAWTSERIESVLSRIGKANRPEPHDYDHTPEEPGLLTDSDRTGGERG